MKPGWPLPRRLRGGRKTHRTTATVTALARADARPVCSPQCASAADEIKDHHHDGSDEQDMNEPAHRVRTAEPDNPENHQDGGDCPQHDYLRTIRNVDRNPRRARACSRAARPWRSLVGADDSSTDAQRILLEPLPPARKDAALIGPWSIWHQPGSLLRTRHPEDRFNSRFARDCAPLAHRGGTSSRSHKTMPSFVDKEFHRLDLGQGAPATFRPADLAIPSCVYDPGSKKPPLAVRGAAWQNRAPSK
jgi:hypothetical protein